MCNLVGSFESSKGFNWPALCQTGGHVPAPPAAALQRKETTVSARFRVIQSDRFANSDVPPIARCLHD